MCLDCQHASKITSVEIGLLVVLVDNITINDSPAVLTLSWSKKTRKVHVQGPGGMSDRPSPGASSVSERRRTMMIGQRIACCLSELLCERPKCCDALHRASI